MRKIYENNYENDWCIAVRKLVEYRYRIYLYRNSVFYSKGGSKGMRKMISAALSIFLMLCVSVPAWA